MLAVLCYARDYFVTRATGRTPFLLFFDSFRNRDRTRSNKMLRSLQGYLRKLGPSNSADIDKLKCVIPLHLKQQGNEADCALWVVHYFAMLFRKQALGIVPSDRQIPDHHDGPRLQAGFLCSGLKEDIRFQPVFSQE